MTGSFHSEDPTGTPTIEVTAYRGTTVLRRELVETEADAVALVAHLEETVGVVCEVHDLSADRSDPTAGEVSLGDLRQEERP